MHPGRWFNETAFDSLDYLVPALLLFVLAAATWAWRYWHRESLRARRIVLSLLTIGAGCLLLWVVLGRRPWWLLLVGLALGPVAVLLRMQFSWMNYQGPPETLQPLPRALEDLGIALTGDETPATVPPHGRGGSDPPESGATLCSRSDFGRSCLLPSARARPPTARGLPALGDGLGHLAQ